MLPAPAPQNGIHSLTWDRALCGGGGGLAARTAIADPSSTVGRAPPRAPQWDSTPTPRARNGTERSAARTWGPTAAPHRPAAPRPSRDPLPLSQRFPSAPYPHRHPAARPIPRSGIHPPPPLPRRWLRRRARRGATGPSSPPGPPSPQPPRTGRGGADRAQRQQQSEGGAGRRGRGGHGGISATATATAAPDGTATAAAPPAPPAPPLRRSLRSVALRGGRAGPGGGRGEAAPPAGGAAPHRQPPAPGRPQRRQPRHREPRAGIASLPAGTRTALSRPPGARGSLGASERPLRTPLGGGGTARCPEGRSLGAAGTWRSGGRGGDTGVSWVWGTAHTGTS